MKKEKDLGTFSNHSYPRSTVLAVASDAEGKPNIITLAWHTPLSHKPPLYGISVGYPRYSYELLAESKEFTVNFLPFDKLDDVHFCGTNSGRRHDKFAETELTLQSSENIAAPGIQEAISILECKVVDEVKVGDHAFFVGEVQRVMAEEKAFDDIMREGIDPILYLGNNVYTNTRGERKRY